MGKQQTLPVASLFIPFWIMCLGMGFKRCPLSNILRRKVFYPLLWKNKQNYTGMDILKVQLIFWDLQQRVWSSFLIRAINEISPLTPLPAQISAFNFHDLTQITQRRVCLNPTRTEKPKAHGFSVCFGLEEKKAALRGFVLPTDIHGSRGTWLALTQSAQKNRALWFFLYALG